MTGTLANQIYAALEEANVHGPQRSAANFSGILSGIVAALCEIAWCHYYTS